MSRASHDPSRRRVWCASCAALFVLALSGCGEKELARVAVEGRVTLDGKPLPAGSILFVPFNGTPGPKSGGPIVAGRYHLAQELGPMVGNLRVEIRGEPAEAPQHPLDDPRHYHENVESQPSLDPVPVVYNDESTLLIDTSAQGPNEFNFDLQSTPPQ